MLCRGENPSNRPGRSTVFFPLPARITTNQEQTLSPMMGVTRALRRNGIFQPWVAVEALADDAHGVSMMVKVAYCTVCEKRGAQKEE